MIYERKETLLTANNVNMSFDGKQVLRDINFTIKNVTRPGVEQGQVVTLLGRSGIGKSTLFNCLAGILPPTTGSILINQEQKPVKIGDMGVVFQDYYIYEWRRVKKLFEFAVSRNPKVKPEERKDVIAEIVAQFDLADHLEKFGNQLSGGQRQRVAIAEQLLNGGNFILLDEPFSGLDVLIIDKVINTLLKVSLSDELKTLIIVSHDLPNSVALSDTVYIMNTEEGKPGATITHEIDLIERGLAWHTNIKDTPFFNETIREIKTLMR